MTTVATVDFYIGPEDGWVQVAANPASFKIKPDVAHPWWVCVSPATPAALVAATGVLTFSGNAATTETVTIGGVVYTFKTSPAVANEVAVGGSTSISIDNLVAAINSGATGGVPHPTVRAVKTSTTVITITAITAGAAGNAIATTETLGSGSWGAATMTGGTDELIGVLMGHGLQPLLPFETSGALTANIYVRLKQVPDSVNTKMHFGVVRDQ